MKKSLFLSLAFVLFSVFTLYAVAPGTSRLYTNDFTIKKGQTTRLQIYIDNPDYEFNACQFDIELTGGITLVDDFFAPTDRIPHDKKDFYMSFGSQIQPGKYRAGFSINSGKHVAGTSGAILEIELKATDDQGKEPISIKFSNIKLSNIDDLTSTESCPETQAKGTKEK